MSDKETPTRRRPLSKKAERRIRLSGMRGSISRMQGCLTNLLRNLDRLAKLEEIKRER